MRLYAAIKQEKEIDVSISSQFNRSAVMECCWYDLIRTALTHVSHGDVKRIVDCWISTSKRLKTAIDYLNNTRYDFTGIAVFDLHATRITGEIYDETLRSFGYIDRIIGEKGDHKNHWTPNADGIVATLDISDPSTVAYICSFLWLKDAREASGNIRAIRYANKDDEVLLLGENITYTYYDRNQVIFLLKEEQASNEIPSLYAQLFAYIYANAPFADVNVLMNCAKDVLPMTLEKYIDYGSDNGYVPNGSKDTRYMTIVDSDDECSMGVLYFDYLRRYHNSQFMKYYKNSVYQFDPARAEVRFKQYHSLSYADKDIIDFEQYEAVDLVGEVDFDKILDAYVYSLCYYMLKDRAEKPESTKKSIQSIFYMINEAYERRFIYKNVSEENFLTYYNSSLGLYAKRQSKVSRDFDLLDLDEFI